MRRLVVVLALALGGVGVGACGHSNENTSSHSINTRDSASTVPGSTATSPSEAATAGGPVKDANDGDYLTLPDRDDDGEVVEYGHAAAPAQYRALASLAKRYIAAAAAEDGATACSLLVAKLLEIVTKRYRHLPEMKGKDCAQAMTTLFKSHHRKLAIESAGLEVTGARVDGNKAYALLAFKTTPERRFIYAERQAGGWKMSEGLLDSPYP